MVSTAFKVMDSVAITVALATEVAVIVAIVVVNKLAGAVYTTEVVVLALNVPGPERVQVTPSLFLSLATVALMVTVCAGFSDSPEAGVRVIPVLLLPPEQPVEANATTRALNASNDKAFDFFTASPLES